MLIFFKVADALLVVGALWIVWNAAIATRRLLTPETERAKEFLRILGKLHGDLERISSQFGEVRGSVVHRHMEDDADIREQ